MATKFNNRTTPGKGFEVQIDKNAHIEAAYLANNSHEMDYFAALVINQFFDIAMQDGNRGDDPGGDYARSLTFERFPRSGSVYAKTDRMIFSEDSAAVAIEVGKKKWKENRRRGRMSRKATNRVRASKRNIRRLSDIPDDPQKPKRGQKGKHVFQQLMNKVKTM
jgi:hypothetical protein